MRCFIAIELDSQTRALLSSIQESFLRQGIKGNYSRAENLHLTVKFLGELDQEQFLETCRLLKKVSPLHPSFVLTLESIGKFNKGNRSIVWAGLKRNESLHKLYGEIEAELKNIIPNIREENYSPHITLIREASLVKGPDTNLLNNGHSFKAEGLSLMESTRVNGVLTYVRRAFEPFV